MSLESAVQASLTELSRNLFELFREQDPSLARIRHELFINFVLGQ